MFILNVSKAPMIPNKGNFSRPVNEKNEPELNLKLDYSMLEPPI